MIRQSLIDLMPAGTAWLNRKPPEEASGSMHLPWLGIGTSWKVSGKSDLTQVQDNRE